ncbi:MAG: cupin domain-containing protein [Acetatifactor sp.]|nr:cupin domain-containing protein [Acetatifactor sp.]
MNIILLSGGSGKRLWPLSNDIRSKQFLKLFKNRDGSYESMIQRVYKQLNNVGISTHVTVATSKKQLSEIYDQLGANVDVCVEPVRKDTFPAIALSAAYLVEKNGVRPTEAVVVCPVDPLVTSDYFRALIALQYQAENGNANIVLMGIVPTHNADKYGYIIPDGDKKLAMVKTFKEKPNRDEAKQFIEQGALWNGGVFAMKLQYVLDKAEELLGYYKYQDLLDHYLEFEEQSFDCAVVEKELNCQVMKFNGEWADMGTWNTLSKAISDPIIGKGVIDETSTDVQILNEMDVPILAMGLHDVVISASPDGILVSDKETSTFIKPFVDEFDEKVRFAEKSWGTFKVLDIESGSMTLKVTLNRGNSMNYHSHKNRDEIWIVISGEGTATLDGRRSNVKKGDIITMRAGCKHTITASKELKLIELQLGEEIREDDKQKFDLPEGGK